MKKWAWVLVGMAFYAVVVGVNTAIGETAAPGLHLLAAGVFFVTAIVVAVVAHTREINANPLIKW